MIYAKPTDFGGHDKIQGDTDCGLNDTLSVKCPGDSNRTYWAIKNLQLKYFVITSCQGIILQAVPRLNTKPVFPVMEFHYKGKMVGRSSYIHDDSPFTSKTTFL